MKKLVLATLLAVGAAQAQATVIDFTSATVGTAISSLLPAVQNLPISSVGYACLGQAGDCNT
jgi:hypothetical protein